MSFEALREWLVAGAPGATSPVDVVERMARDLVGGRVPLARLAVFVTTLHPNVLGRSFTWEPGTPVRVNLLTDEIRRSHEFTDSPVAWVGEHRAELRWRAGEPDRGFGVLRTLAARGCVEYVGMPLCFTNGEVHAVTYACHAALSDAQMEALRGLLEPLARVAEIYALRRLAENLVTTYVGTRAGARVLAGKIHRGDVETIRAAIWFSDLRGYTELSGRTPAKELIATINRVFDAQVPAVEQRGGEVLKFIGDGMLAIFPEGGGIAGACAAALDAARQAVAAVAATETGGPPLRIGVGLHVGDVEYGNIGGASRLDFTAIGAAVNLAARLEGLTGKLGRAVVVSDAFARAHGGRFDELGAFELKGVGAPQRAFAPSA